MKQLATILSLLVLIVASALPAVAQDETPTVTVRQINAIPEANITELQTRGADLSNDEVYDLIRSEYVGETVRFTAIVLSDPLTSGLASMTDDGPGRVHIFVRDTTAVHEGTDGMDIQIVDGSYDETGTINLVVGDVVTFTAEINYFSNTVQVAPQGQIEVLGDISSFNFPASILDPVDVQISDLVTSLGPQQVQANWENLSRYNNQFVRIEDATVWRSPNPLDNLPNYALTQDGAQTIIHSDAVSLRYRNDQAGYPDDWNKRAVDDPFEAPPQNATVDIQGFVLLRGTFDAFGIGTPPGALIKIAPWEDEDLVVTGFPLITDFDLAGLEGIPGDEDVEITAVFNGQLSDVESVVLTYETSATEGEQQVTMTQETDTSFVGTIPVQENGVFVSYSAILTDVDDRVYNAPTSGAYRVMYGGISEIRFLQETRSGGAGASPFAGQTVDMDITATVQTDPAGASFLTVQDDSEPWSGIFVELTDDVLDLDLAPGDQVQITRGAIAEIRGDLNFANTTANVTAIRDPEMTRLGEGTVIEPVVLETGDLLDSDVTAAYQAMLLRFENVIITNPDAGFGEWAFSTDGEEANELLADDISGELGSDFASSTFEEGDEVTFIQGILSYSFGNNKLLPRGFDDIGDIVGTSAENGIVSTFELKQNYPNPFNPSTRIDYSVATTGPVQLEVFDMLGRRVATLVDGDVAAGEHSVTFEANSLGSGLYLYRLRAGDNVTTRTMMLIK